jgi:hypothetical protein
MLKNLSNYKELSFPDVCSLIYGIPQDIIVGNTNERKNIQLWLQGFEEVE